MSSDSRSSFRSRARRAAEQSRVDRHAAAAHRCDLAPARIAGVPGLDADRLWKRREQVVPRVQCPAAGDRRRLLPHGVADEARVHRDARELRHVGRARDMARARRGRQAGRSACRAARAGAAFSFISAAKELKSGATESASASAASFADWISAASIRSCTESWSPGSQPGARLTDRGGTWVDGDDVRELLVVERHEHRHQLRDRGDRQLRVRVGGSEHLAGRRVLDDPGARAHGRSSRMRRRRDSEDGEERAERDVSLDPDLLADVERRSR